MTLLADVENWTPLTLSLTNASPSSWTALRADSVQALREWLASIHRPVPSNMPLLRINTFCGETVEYQTADDVPVVDTPCPCGNPNHWLIQFTK